MKLKKSAHNNPSADKPIEQAGTEAPKKGYASPGLRHAQTTTLFRVTNFELYATPNKFVMGIGLLAVTGCLGYLLYMRSYAEKNNMYTAMNEDGSLSYRKRKSKWE